MKLSDNRHSTQTYTFSSLLTVWFIINILQSIFTEIHSDEAYYALYGKYLDWGYFDHPPMVALMTHVSSLLFKGNLGVRFVTVIIQLVCLILTWRLIHNEKKSISTVYIFFVTSFATIMFSAYGFITTPDAPLLLFTALFLYGYKRFLTSSDWRSTTILIISATGLIYSKYQGVLVILLVLLSNWKLIKSVKFWIIVFTSFILLLPHIYWQYINDFPTIKYHIVSRASGFDWGYLLEYIPNQLITFNPFVIGAVLYILYKYKAQDLFEKSLYYIIIGFITFFGLSAFRGHVEPHWTVASSIAMIILIVNRSETNHKTKNYVKRFILPSIGLILIIRVLITTTLLPEDLHLHSKYKQYEATHAIAGDVPVIYTGSFQNPSLYHFFTGEKCTVISSVQSRISQFDIWNFQTAFQGKRVFVCTHVDGKSQIFKTKTGIDVEGYFTDSLQTTNHIKIDFDCKMSKFVISSSQEIEITLTNPSDTEFYLFHKEFPANLQLILINKDNTICIPAQIIQPFSVIPAHQMITSKIRFEVPKIDEEKYHLGVSLNSVFGPSLNSKFININISKQ
jgi:uncharacterized membrane protein YoaK (UPF0700 family)